MVGDGPIALTDVSGQPATSLLEGPRTAMLSAGLDPSANWHPEGHLPDSVAIQDSRTGLMDGVVARTLRSTIETIVGGTLGGIAGVVVGTMQGVRRLTSPSPSHRSQPSVRTLEQGSPSGTAQHTDDDRSVLFDDLTQLGNSPLVVAQQAALDYNRQQSEVGSARDLSQPVVGGAPGRGPRQARGS